jgi:hypothetical protein
MGVLRVIGEEDVMLPQIASACFHLEEVYSGQKCLAQSVFGAQLMNIGGEVERAK